MIKKIFIAGVICILVQSAGCKSNMYQETEPNNAFQTANEVQIDKPVEGYINSKDDIDVYKITISAASVMSVQLSSVKGINHAIKIWKQTAKGPEFLKLIDDARKSSPEYMANIGVEPGDYYIQIFHGDRDSKKGREDIAYLLTLKTRAMEQEEYEPNDFPGSENKIEIGQTYKGYFSPAFNKMNKTKKTLLREEDRFVFHVQGTQSAPQMVDVVLSGVPGVNSEIALYDPDGKQVAVADANGAGDGESLKGLGLFDSGNYVVVVYSKNYQVNHTTPYSLEVVQKEFDPTMEMEPNNSAEQSNLLLKSTMQGRISGENDRDYFMYQYTGEPSLVTLTLNPPQNMDITMTIFDKEQNELFEVDNKGAGESEIVPGLYFEASCFIQVSAKAGSYDADATYQLLLDIMPYNNVFEIEPNNTQKNASPAVDTLIKGYITQRKDKDYFLLRFNKRVRKQITVQGIENADFDVSITDQLGYIIKTETVTGEKPVIFSEMIDGKAYILVEAKTEPLAEPYTIEIGDVE